MNIGYLFYFPNYKSKSLKINNFNKNHNKNNNKNNKLYNTFTDYNYNFDLPNNDSTKLTKFNCINCNKINYEHKLFCDIDCKTSYGFKNKNEN